MLLRMPATWGPALPDAPPARRSPHLRSYKAYFRWNHYSFKLRNGTQQLPTETDACASVTAAFLQVRGCGRGRRCKLQAGAS